MLITFILYAPYIILMNHLYYIIVICYYSTEKIYTCISLALFSFGF